MATHTLEEHCPTSEELQDIQSVFQDPDLSLIKAIIYFDGWSDYEECGGILIFRGIDDSIQCVEYGYFVFNSSSIGDKFSFDLEDIPEWDALERIERMEAAITE